MAMARPSLRLFGSLGRARSSDEGSHQRSRQSACRRSHPRTLPGRARKRWSSNSTRSCRPHPSPRSPGRDRDRQADDVTRMSPRATCNPRRPRASCDCCSRTAGPTPGLGRAHARPRGRWREGRPVGLSRAPRTEADERRQQPRRRAAPPLATDSEVHKLVGGVLERHPGWFALRAVRGLA